MSSARTLLRGLAALVALTAAVVGLPVALLSVGGSPIPDALPHLGDLWDTLTSRDDGTVMLAALRVVAWAGWALFTMSVLADLLARLRRVPVPHLGPQQAIASHLIAAVAAISVLAPAATPAGAAPLTTSTNQATTSAPSWTGLSARLDAADHAAQATHHQAAADQVQARRHHRTWQTYRVHPGDTLWDIADDHLGDPFRWPEIYAASLTVDQPDGQHLRDPDLIRPGWTLRVPRGNTHPDDAAGERARRASDEQATDDALALRTPFTGGDVPAAASAVPSTPLSAGRGDHSQPQHVILAEDWRGQVRAAVAELG